jgi:hypothetical protein
VQLCFRVSLGAGVGMNEPVPKQPWSVDLLSLTCARLC